MRARAGRGAAKQLSRDPRGYHLNKRHWNTISLDGSLADQLVWDLIEDSYDLVASAVPKRVREDLGWAPGTNLTQAD